MGVRACGHIHSPKHNILGVMTGKFRRSSGGEAPGRVNAIGNPLDMGI